MSKTIERIEVQCATEGCEATISGYPGLMSTMCVDCALKEWEEDELGIKDIYELAEELFEEMSDAESYMTEYEKDKYSIDFRHEAMRKHLDKLKEQANEA